jgi:hypothetical protein
MKDKYFMELNRNKWAVSQEDTRDSDTFLPST